MGVEYSFLHDCGTLGLSGSRRETFHENSGILVSMNGTPDFVAPFERGLGEISLSMEAISRKNFEDGFAG